MSTNQEVSNEVRDFLIGIKDMIDEIIDAHDKLNDFISKKAPKGNMKDKDYSEYIELSNRFKELTKQFSDKVKEYMPCPTTKS